MRKYIIIIFVIIILSILFISCQKQTPCEAFEIMNSGNYTIKFSIDGFEGEVFILSQNDDTVILCEFDNDILTSELMFQDDKNYIVSVDTKEYKTTPDSQLFDIRKAKFKYDSYELRKDTNEKVYIFIKNMMRIEYVYCNNELSKIICRYGLTEDAYSVSLNIKSILPVYYEDAIWNIPEEFNLVDDFSHINPY